MGYIVSESCIAARDGEQLTDDVHVTMLAGAHERGGAVVISDVDLSSTGQQRPHHVPSAVTHRQH